MGLFGKKNKNEAPEAPAPVAAPAPAAAPAPTPAPTAQSTPPPFTAPAPQPAPVATPAPQQQASAPPSSPPETAPATQSAPALTEEASQQALNESQHAMLAVGHLMVFMLNSPDLRNAPLEHIRSLVLPAVANQQFIVAMARNNQTGHITPAGVAIWARVSDAIDQRLSTQTDQPFNLGANDWKSGPNPWLLMLAGAPAGINPQVAEMKAQLFPDKPLKMRIAKEDGSVVVTHFNYDPQTHEAIRV